MSKKIVLITGTNSGFGWLAAHSVAAAGHHVYATMRDTQGRNAGKARALAAVENVTVLDVTLTDEQSVKQADGLIINVTSGFGRVSFPFATIYAASKFALEGISEGLHYEVKRLGIDVALLEPGAFPTEMQQKNNPASDQAVFEGYGAIADMPNKMVASLGGEMQAKKPDPQDVADAIVRLIGTPKGTRPLRTVVDPITGQYIEAANQAVAEQFAKGLTVFGMSELL